MIRITVFSLTMALAAPAAAQNQPSLAAEAALAAFDEDMARPPSPLDSIYCAMITERAGRFFSDHGDQTSAQQLAAASDYYLVRVARAVDDGQIAQTYIEPERRNYVDMQDDDYWYLRQLGMCVSRWPWRPNN